MASRFWVGGTGTWDASDTTHWASSSNGAGGQSVPGSADTVTIDASSGTAGATYTITVNTSFTILSLNMDAATGTTTGAILDFATNNNSPTFTASAGFSAGGTGTRTLNMGSGTWTLSSGAASWIATVSLTLSAGTSTIAFTATTLTNNRTFTSGGLTYNAVTFASPTLATSGFQITWGGAATIASLTFGAGTYVVWPALTNTITTLVASGTASRPILFLNASNSTSATLALTTATMAWNVLKNITCTGSPTATNSLDAGNNSGITIAPPVLGVIGG